ncbi:MAG: transcription elongation factor GreA [Anaerolineaceae bacterium]|nr:transcription elongation factor GreA [Anaerolineaceae bacterium]
MTATILLTEEGYKKLSEELQYLRDVRRQEVAERLHNAIEDGADVLENAEYEAAMNEQAFVEGRISEIEMKLSMAKIVANKHDPDSVQIGSTVTIQEEDFDPEVYHVVGAAEADATHGKISHDSPLGKALMGRKMNDKVLVKAPAGAFEVVILKIE